MKKEKLNGSAALLIEGLQGVIKKTMREEIKPVIDTMADMEKRLVDKIDGVEQRLDAKIDGVEKRTDKKIEKQIQTTKNGVWLESLNLQVNI